MNRYLRKGFLNLISFLVMAMLFILFEAIIWGIEDSVIVSALLLGIYYISPAYIANGFATVFGKKIRSPPIDFHKKFIDGEPIFGEGKTIAGFIGGFLISTILGTIIFTLINYSTIYSILEFYNLTEHGKILSLISFSKEMSPLIAAIIGLGALLGDLAGAFIKRRFKLKRGTFVPILDQIDFVAGALAFSSLFLLPDLLILATIFFVTPAIHAISNIVGYLLKVKKEPW
ncbi:MAG: CDP-2,3-bis-(O-geranylgeranyl)-sn-glycerol synthase [Candidatus Asgardarchaeia archaeon]